MSMLITFINIFSNRKETRSYNKNSSESECFMIEKSFVSLEEKKILQNNK